MADDNREEEEKKDFIPNPPELDGVCDLSQLIYMEMPHVLHNLEWRYCKMPKKYCYTSISSILLAINPYEYLPIYGDDVIQQFKKAADRGRLPTDRPHPYGVSARSYMRLIQRKKNQSVIVCGESGSGKTETTKKLLKYLAVTAPSSTIESKTIEDQIVAASPILESFGNAKTVMNNNSSRFGKFTKLLYSVPENEREGNILGSFMETYLLEKSRVVFQAENERNYHIFYFLITAFKNDSVKMNQLCLDKMEVFDYINQGKVTETFKDLENYQELTESLEKFRINRDEQDVLWQVTSGILNMGNIVFKKQGDGYCDIDLSKCEKYINNVAKLWDIKTKALIDRLTTASVVINRKTIVKKINFDDAASNRDSIAKGIYENVFLWLCERINEELFLDEAKGDEKTRTDLKFIGILDVFGFENFWDNSLEQFCINYTNEKLQQYFNYHIIMSEQEEYLKESVMWTPLSIPDNKEYLDLVEDKTTGFFALLDSQCKGPAKDDTTAFMQQLFKKHGNNKTIKKATKQGAGSWRGTKKKKVKGKNKSRGERFQGFIINHYADDVSYNALEFLKKNAESVHADTFKMIKKSSRPILQQIKQAKSKKKKTVTSVFHKGIKTLFKNLEKTEPYFVRCVNPNKNKSSQEWTESIVEHQLRCGGLLEALKVLKLGYPTRVPYKTLYEKYHGSVDNPLIKNMNEASFSTSLLIAFDVNEEDYELGLTKIFFKPAKAAILDTIMSKAGEPLTKEQNEKITKYIVGKRINQLMGTVRAFVKFRRDVRKARATIAWKYSGRVASILGATVVKQLFAVRKQIEERNKLNGALSMQKMYRGYKDRMEYKNNINKIKNATNNIWRAYRTMQRRQHLEQWFMEKQAERAKAKAEELARLAEEEKQRLAAEAAAAKKLADDEEARKKQKEQEEKEKEEQKKQEQEAKKAAEEAAELLKAAAAAKKNRVTFAPLTPRSADEEAKEKEMEHLALQEQIEAKRKTQQLASARLKKAKTKKMLEIAEDRRVRRNETIEATADERRTADMAILAAASQQSELPDDEEDDFSTSSDEKDEEDEWSSSEDDFDITELLDNFQQIARLGAKFSRHAGKRIHKKPQLRTVKVSFDEDGKPSTLSWGAGSRAIKMKDIWYISWGHCTPTFLARKDKLEPMKCFSIVGHSEKQVLDLEAYTKRDAKIWVKGLRKLINQSDKKADELAEMNLQRLMQYAQKQQQAKQQLKDKQLRVVKLQQDLFVMTVEAVYKELEEQKIWKIDNNVRKHFDAATMYENVLKQDVAWRKWQWYVREQITNYLRENNLVRSNHASTNGATPRGNTNNNNNNNNNNTDNDDNKATENDEIALFLKYYKLHKYDAKLRDAGLEKLSDLKSLDSSSILSITKEVSMQTLHQNKFVAACKDLQSGKYPPKEIKEASMVDKWLEQYNLMKYSSSLKKNGLNRLEDINHLNSTEIEALASECNMGVLHKKKFIGACQEFKQKYKSMKRNTSSNTSRPLLRKTESEGCLIM